MAKAFVFKSRKYITRSTVSGGGGVARVRSTRIRRSWLRDKILGYPKKYTA